MSEETAVVLASQGAIVRAEDFLPLLTVPQMVERKRQINQFISDVLTDGEDYGQMPGGQTKKVLLKPGSEKLCSIFGLAPRYVAEEVIEDWTGAAHGGEPLFYYRYRCQLYRGEKFMGEAIGSANSWEAKHRYRWVKEEQALACVAALETLPTRESTISEFQFAINKAETSGKYGKPAEYWRKWQDAIKSGEAKPTQRVDSKGVARDAWEMGGKLYRIPNPDGADVVNTCQKMAQKRALVAAVLVVTNCSDAFTQDLEDAEPDPRQGVEHIDTGGHPMGTQAAADHVANGKIANGTPKELKTYFDSIDKNAGACAQIFELLSHELKKHNALGEYDRIERAFTEKYPKGTKDKELLKIVVRQLWDALQKAKTPVDSQAETDLFNQPEAVTK